MMAALAQAGSERLPSMTGASDVLMRTARALGRTKGCGDPGAPPDGASISSDGGDAGTAAGAARASPLASAQTSATAGASAPNAFLLLRTPRSEEHTSELQSLRHLVCR